jgi:cellulose synthase/poly-beta-1,6-N-acetylglucosamine synthase-like glycosyltransferase
MMLLLSVLAFALSLLVSLPLLVLAIECFLALLPAKKCVLGERKSCALLIPAFNEEQGLGATLRNIQTQVVVGDRVIVVAHNCTDRTAEIASDFGAEVVLKNEAEKRGKGFALEAGVDYLQQSVANGSRPPEVVVIVDADCLFAEGALDSLVRLSGSEERPLQAQYLMHSSETAKPLGRLSAFAFLTKNRIRLRGLDRAGLAVPLTGSGMAFPWGLIKNLNLGTSEIVEDLDLGLQLVMAGHGPKFCEAARVDSFFPATPQAAYEQRTRWEHGYLMQMVKKVPALFREGLRGNWQAWAAGLDLLVPPLSLLVMLAALASFLLTAYFAYSQDLLPITILLVSCALASTSLFLTWFRFGRQTITLLEILWIPAYAGKKVSMYLALPFNAQREWRRTNRSSHSVPLASPVDKKSIGID